MTTVYTLEDIATAAKQTLEFVKDKKVLAFHGEMGAGKTTLIHALCDQLNIAATVGSPTYSIINEYATKDQQKVYHMDWYRLKDEEEALQAGVEDVLYSNNICFVEWPEKAPALLPEDAAHIFIELIDEQARKVTIK